MSPDEMKQMARNWMQGWKDDLPRAADTYLHPDFVDHSAPPGTPQGREGAKATYQMMKDAFPDIDFTLEDMVATGDRIAVRTSWRATHGGPLMGLPPTGKHIQWNSMTIMTVQDGQFKEHWGAFDQVGMMQQLGVIPSQG